jgi:hypothetical protein
VLDEDVAAFLVKRGHVTAGEFGTKFDASQVPLLAWGNQAEFRPITADGRGRIFINRNGADWWRVRYQLAHEIFHWCCTPPGTFHWTHEMFAVEMAVRAMEELGEHEYVRMETERLSDEADWLPLATMLVMPFQDEYPAGLYGRAWTVGRDLAAAITWERLKPLASCLDSHGKPDVRRWVCGLDYAARDAVEQVLGAVDSTWV